jgi:hypothetical protein
MRLLARCAVGIAAVAVAFACTPGHPSDVRMERAFVEQRPAFERLAELAAADTGLWRVSETWYRTRGGENREAPSADLPAERWQRYRAYFRTLDLDAGVSIDDGSVYLERSAAGLGISGSGKGFVRWRGSAPPRPTCRSLDGVPPADKPAGASVCYKRLTNEWYLFYSQS